MRANGRWILGWRRNDVSTRALCCKRFQIYGNWFFLSEFADGHDLKADDISLIVNTLHDGIVFRFDHSSRRIGIVERDFQEISFSIVIYIYVLFHKNSLDKI